MLSWNNKHANTSYQSILSNIIVDLEHDNDQIFIRSTNDEGNLFCNKFSIFYIVLDGYLFFYCECLLHISHCLHFNFSPGIHDSLFRSVIVQLSQDLFQRTIKIYIAIDNSSKHTTQRFGTLTDL